MGILEHWDVNVNKKFFASLDFRIEVIIKYSFSMDYQHWECQYNSYTRLCLDVKRNCLALRVNCLHLELLKTELGWKGGTCNNFC